MKAPTCIKDVQKLTGCRAALNKFISKLGERGLPFFKLLKHQDMFAWTPEADQVLAQLKDFLSKPPVLTAPHKNEQLLLYLAATTHGIEGTLSTSTEVTVCSAHHLAEVTTVLPWGQFG
jgi:hypothetical protein